MNIRFATPADGRALLRIYGQYIETPVTFECELPSEEAFAARIASIAAEYPYLVCEEEGAVVGYAYAHRAWERAAYRWNAELSVYLDRTHTARGLGEKLYQTLIGLLQCQGIKTVYGCVTVPNEKSERLHEKLGFRRLGVYRGAGYKAGAWHDVAWFEKEIGPHDAEPEPPLPVGALAEETVAEIFQNACRGGMRLMTQRLELIALTPRQLRLWTEEIGALEAELDCRYRAEPMEGIFLQIVRGQVEMAERDAENYLWHSFWLLVRKSDRAVVGSADFKNIPNGAGEVEVGYGLGKEHEHNGYMTEAVAAMRDWALSQRGVTAVIAETERDGAASQRILARCGFERCREEETLWWRVERRK